MEAKEVTWNFEFFFFGLNFAEPTGLGICDVEGISM